jgi:hypothetical protein
MTICFSTALNLLVVDLYLRRRWARYASGRVTCWRLPLWRKLDEYEEGMVQWIEALDASGCGFIGKFTTVGWNIKMFTSAAIKKHLTTLAAASATAI